MGVLTKKEIMEKIHNEILEMCCKNEIDIEFFKTKANHFKKNTPEHKGELEKMKQQEGYLFWNNMLLKTIKKLIV